MAGGIRVDIDASELADFAKVLEKTQKLTKPAMALGLNEVGDGLVSLMATSVSKQSGLTLEVIRGSIKIKRASRSDLSYQMTLDPNLFSSPAQSLQGASERTDFLSKTAPDTLVIVVSKKDELVCMDCEELDAAGPMPLSVANAHVPKHPHCRCIILPYVQKGQRLPVTMTSLSGTDPAKRAGVDIGDMNLTLRQMAQRILDSTASKIKIGLSA